MTGEAHESIKVPEAWEHLPTPRQMDLVTNDGFANLSEAERLASCQALLGDLRRTYRQLMAHATRVRERVMADRLQGDAAIMSRPHAGDNDTARAMALVAITDWFYQDGQGEKETSVYMGAVASSKETLGAIMELNRLKVCFSEGMDRIKAVLDDEMAVTELNKVYAALAPDSPLNVRRKVVGAMVRQVIHPRLNIRQLVRHAPVLPVCPDRVRWKWTATPSSLRISRQALLEVLESRQDIAARYDIEAVAGCSDPEFSWEKGVTEDCRIGAFCKSATLDPLIAWNQKNVSFKGRLPLFYLSPRLAPYIKNPKPRKNLALHKLKPQMVMAGSLTELDPESLERRRGKTVREPFLKSINVRRYLKYAERE